MTKNTKIVVLQQHLYLIFIIVIHAVAIDDFYFAEAEVIVIASFVVQPVVTVPPHVSATLLALIAAGLIVGPVENVAALIRVEFLHGSR